MKKLIWIILALVLIAGPAYAEKQYIYLGASRMVLGSNVPYLGYVSPYLIGAGQDAETLTALIAAGYTLAAGSTTNIADSTTESGALDLNTMDGGSGTEIVFDGGTAGSQATWTNSAGWTFGDYTFLYDLEMVGPVKIGTSSKIERCKLR